MSFVEQPELTQRQQQILELLKVGKVNKEVARELDIGLGTVKQHIVAIFKKLKVRNRTEAASRLQALQPEPKRNAPSELTDALLTRRPCVVLSMALSKNASPALIAAFYGELASVASTHDAIFLTRQGNAGEVIFGVQQVTEYDVAIALQTAHHVYQSLLVLQPTVRQQVRGCLSAGVALASMRRFGGWTGEAIASAAIASARDLLQATADGLVRCDQAVFDLCGAFGVSGFDGLPGGVAFDALASMQWQGVRRSHALVGRKSELSHLLKSLDLAFAGHEQLVLMEGEMGMGKTRLCQELLRVCQSKGGKTRCFRGLPPILGSGLCDLDRACGCEAKEVISALQNRRVTDARLILVDDFQLINQVQKIELIQIAVKTNIPGRLVVFSGRHGLCQMAPQNVQCLHLRRLSPSSMQELIRQMLNMPRGKLRTAMTHNIIKTATGVPLFAVELAQCPNTSNLSLSLLVAVHSRLDKLHLDSSLLRVVAQKTSAVSITELADTLPDDHQSLLRQVERAVAAGVLARGFDGRLSFAHPMLQRAINDSVTQ